MGSLSQPFAGDYAALQAKIETVCVSYLNEAGESAKAITLKQLIQTHD
jgi:hypothetical protein